jgi:S1-C subfamily serine protease
VTRAAFAAALTALMLSPRPAAAALEREALVRLGASMVRIEAPRDGGGLSFGSGVAVARDTVVTNCHVTRDARRIVAIHAGTRRDVTEQASDLPHDLCLLHAPGLDATPVGLGRSAVLASEQSLTALGYTGGAGLQASAGEVIALHRLDGARVIQSSNYFTSGASGGGLFDDSGALVGVLTFRLRGDQTHYYAAPAEWVQQLINAAEHGAFVEVMPLAREPASYWEAAEAARPRFLEAAALMHAMRWADLQQRARAWLRVEPDDAQPWLALGMALVRLGQTSAGRHALECALRLDAANRIAREWLAQTPAAAGSRSSAATTACEAT